MGEEGLICEWFEEWLGEGFRCRMWRDVGGRWN